METLPDTSKESKKHKTRPYIRKKSLAVAIACDGCRRRKVKCDRKSNSEPCVLCTHRGIPCIEPSNISIPVDSEDDANKRKRQQYTACDTCRLRRVRCVREEGDESCHPCLKRGVICTSLFISSVRNHAPKGKQRTNTLDQTLTQIDPLTSTVVDPLTSTSVSTTGPTDSSGSSPSQSPNSSNSSTSGGYQIYPNLFDVHFDRYEINSKTTTETSHATPIISLPSPIENAMVHSTIETTLTNHLLLCYHDTVHQHLPFFDWTFFYQRFEANDNKPYLMDTRSEALCAVLMAFGARVTDSPLVLSENAPKTYEVPDLIFSGADLSRFGRKRDAFCDHMTRKAFTKCKDADILTKPSVDSIITLTLLITITGGEGGRYDTSEMNPRVFGVALFEHFRQLMDPRDPTSKDHLRILTGAFRLAVMRDSLFAALSGRILQANDEDLELYWPEILNQRSTSFTEPLNMCLKEMKFKEVTRQQLFSTPWENQSASNMFGKMVMEARMIAKLVSGPVAAQRSRIDLSYIRNHVWKDVDATVTWILSYMLLENPKLLHWLRGLALWRHILIQSVDIGLKTHYDNIIARNDSSDRLYLNDLGAALLESSQKLFGSLRQIVQALKKSNGKVTTVPFGSGGLFFRQICVCYEMMIKVACEEDGGIKGWTLEKKIEDLQYLLHALREKGWSIAESEQHIEIVENAITELQEKSATQVRQTPKPMEELQTHGSVALSSLHGPNLGPAVPANSSASDTASSVNSGRSSASIPPFLHAPQSTSSPLLNSAYSAASYMQPSQGLSRALRFPPSRTPSVQIPPELPAPHLQQSRFQTTNDTTVLPNGSSVPSQEFNVANFLNHSYNNLGTLPLDIKQTISAFGNSHNLSSLPPQLLATLSSQPNLLPPSLQAFLPITQPFSPVPAQDLLPPSAATSFLSENDVLAPFLSNDFDWQTFSMNNQ